MRHPLRLALLALALLAAPAAAGNGDLVAALPACNAAEPWEVYLAFESSDTDCTDDPTDAGSTVAKCCCNNGSVYSCKGTTGGGSGDSFTTINTPSGTDPVADSSTDTLNLASGAAALSITGDSATDTVTLDIAGTASKCARFDGSGELVPASGDCSAGDTGTVRPPSWDNPPASPGTYDCEFDGSICGYSAYSSGTTNPVAAGTIDYTASLTTPIYDITSDAYWIRFQSDSSSVATFGIRKSYTPASNETWFIKFGTENRNVSANGEGTFYLLLDDSADANEFVAAGLAHNASTFAPFLQVNNNGALTTVFFTGITESVLNPIVYLVVWKKSDVYHYAIASQGGVFTYGGNVTKTGDTTLDRAGLTLSTANETPSLVEGADFIRYYNSLNYTLLNP